MREAQRRVKSAEFTEWVTYYRLFPWSHGDAMLAALISNIARSRSTSLKSIADFLPGLKEIEPTDPWEQFKRVTGTDG